MPTFLPQKPYFVKNWNCLNFTFDNNSAAFHFTRLQIVRRNLENKLLHSLFAIRRTLVCPVALAVIVCALVVAPASAVVVQSGAENMTPPLPAEDDPGFANIGISSTGGASVTYLGNRWILTNNHVTINGNAIRFGNFASPVVTTSKVRLLNANGSGADLVMYQLAADPHLPSLYISTDTPAIGTPVTMIGNGRARGAPLSDGSGYAIDASKNTIRWGTNVVSGSGYWESTMFGAGRAFHTRFDSLGPNSNEAQASRGDSGGGAFVFNGGGWELAGIMYMGSDDLSGVHFGDESSFVDLKSYRAQIMSVFAASLPVVRGDANSDGIVDFSDLGLIINNWGQVGSYTDGDFDLSGTVDFSDIGLLINNFGLAVGVEGEALPIPEPGTLWLVVALGIPLGLAVLRRHLARRRAATPN